MAFAIPALTALTPTLLATTAAASTVVGAVSAHQSAQFDKRMAKRQALIHQQNAQIARKQAASQAQQAERRSRLRLGAIKAAGGASGAAGTGSVIDILGDVATQGELERQNELFKGELAARGQELGAEAARAERDLASQRGRFGLASAALGAPASAARGFSAGLSLTR